MFNDMQLFRLWVICLTEATHKGYDQMVGKQIVRLEPGQFVTGRFDLHSMYNQGLKKKEMVTEYTVWRWLKTLEEGEFLSIKSHSKYSVVSVVNWEFYQCREHENDQQMSNKRAADEQQMSTNKNVKNVKKEYTSEFESFWSIYPRQKEKSKAFKCWGSRSKEGTSPDDMIKAAKNYAAEVKRKGTQEDYIKLPATFLGPSKPYEDYMKTSIEKVNSFDWTVQQQRWIDEGNDPSEFVYKPQ